MSDNEPRKHLGIKLSKDVESTRSIEAQEEATLARLAELAQDRSMMERWDDFMMDRPVLAWPLLLGGIFAIASGLGLIATYFGIAVFGVVAGLIIAALVFAITR